MADDGVHEPRRGRGVLEVGYVLVLLDSPAVPRKPAPWWQDAWLAGFDAARICHPVDRRASGAVGLAQEEAPVARIEHLEALVFERGERLHCVAVVEDTRERIDRFDPPRLLVHRPLRGGVAARSPGAG